MLSLGQLYTDDTSNDNDDANDDDNDTRWTNHDCIGSLACMPNEPKTSNEMSHTQTHILTQHTEEQCKL